MKEYSTHLRAWLEKQWADLNSLNLAEMAELNRLGPTAPEWQPLSGDAGFRRYFRLRSKPSLLAVYAPPATEDMTAFINIAQHLRMHGVLVPSIIAFDKTQGFILIEDLGCSLLFDQLNSNTVDHLYNLSLKSLLGIQQAPVEPSIFPTYSIDKLSAEMSLFREWFVPQLLGLSVTATEETMLNDWFLLLARSAVQQPQVLVHRDYHSRNLVYREDGPPGIIDFQDAVVGPITYDLVSLLRDCYIAWPDEQVNIWALSYLKMTQEAGLTEAVTEEQFLHWFDWMGLQRHIKVLGIFARLSLRDGKHGYLNDLPLVIDYVLRISKRYPQAEAFVLWFEQKLMPAVAQQSWYRVKSMRPE